MEECIFDTRQVNQALYGLCAEAKHQAADRRRGRGCVIILAGPTACGKSELALMLASQVGGEIICADSMQVYRGMDIGTAKASQADQLKIPHHLLDTHSITEPFTVVDFYNEAAAACRLILDRGNAPIVVGGAGFYLHSLLYGPPTGPASDPVVRQSLEEKLSQLGVGTLYRRLQELDPAYAKTITENDKHKVVRALEIIHITGQKVSDFQRTKRVAAQPFEFCCWFLHRPRETLYRRIERRCQRMCDLGLLDEIAALEKKGLALNTSAAQSIGYRQGLEYLASGRSEKDYEDFLRRFKQASRRYAKRQFTWFRRESLYRWLDVDVHDFEIAIEMILKDYDRRC